MRGDRDWCLETLGLGAGASGHEIKAAYRDLAKVWHPDRFAQDPRLQQKAQEQLKEINDAYRRLASGDHPTRDSGATRDDSETRDDNAARRANEARAYSSSAATAATGDAHDATLARRKVSRLALAAPALAFCATFAFVTPRLLSNYHATTSPDGPAAAPARGVQDESASETPHGDADAARDARAEKPPANVQRAATQTASVVEMKTAGAQPAPRALPTVTVSIDPATGLRARADCPHKSAMTFPAGDEPAAYCDAAHRAPQPARPAADGDDARAGKSDESRLKSFAGRLASPAKKLFGGTRPHAPDKKPADADAAAPRN